MQNRKKLAFAIAAILAIPAQSYADVTIYGFMSGGVESINATGNGAASKEVKTTSRVVDENSRIGFLGKEDLGNGLKAIWQVESSLRSFEQGGTNDKGQTASLATRNTFVGLDDSHWGTVQLGLYDTAYKRLTDLGMNVFANTVGDLNAGGSVVYNRRVARLANSVHYTTPVWNGWQAGISYGADEARQVTTDNIRSDDYRTDAAVNYTNGGLQFGLGYDHEGDVVKASTTTPTTYSHISSNTNGYKAGVSYIVPRTGTYIGIGFERVQINVVGAVKTQQNDYMLALSQPLSGALSLKAAYAVLGELDGVTNPNDYKAKQWLIGATYDMSKRTQLFAYGSKINNSAAQNANFGVNPIYTSAIGTSSASLDKGNDPQAFGVGMKVAF